MPINEACTGALVSETNPLRWSRSGDELARLGLSTELFYSVRKVSDAMERLVQRPGQIKRSHFPTACRSTWNGRR